MAQNLKQQRKTLFMILIIILGFACAVWLFYNLKPINATVFIVFALLNLLYSIFVITLPSGINFNLAYPLNIGFFMLYGPGIALLAMLPGILLNSIRRHNLLNSFFNFAQYTLCFTCCHFLYSAFYEYGFIINLKQDFLFLLLIVLCADLTNNLIVSFALGFDSYRNFKELFFANIYKDVFKITPLFYSIGIITAISYQQLGVFGVFLLSFPVLGIYFIFRDQEIIKKNKLNAMTDPLTGLYNRLFLNNWSKENFAKHKNSSDDLTLLMIDIDNFKAFNDTFGHLAGDETLKKFATLLKEIVRSDDLIIRYGGEEFLLILVDSSIKEGIIISQRIKQTVTETVFIPSEKKEALLTVSIGITQLNPASSKDFMMEDLIRQADKNLFQAKYSGKNKIVAN